MMKIKRMLMPVPKGFSLQALKLPKASSLFSRFFARSARPNGEESIDSVVSSGTVIRGDIAFTGVLRVDGYIEGRLEAQSEQALLVVGESATLRGDVSAVDAVICGLVEGNVVVQRFLELRPGARVIGDVTYCQIEMHVGASVDGRMVHAEDNTVQALLVPGLARA
jgi:cytoskeletal protein CcmA (bactofilin family)